MSSYPPEQEMLDRLRAIEAVSHAHPGVSVVEHMLLDLVAFLQSGRLGRDVAVEMLATFIAAEPGRVGSVETLEFCVAILGWDDLTAALVALRDSDSADFRNRDLAREALAASRPDWHGGAFRTFQ